MRCSAQHPMLRRGAPAQAGLNAGWFPGLLWDWHAGRAGTSRPASSLTQRPSLPKRKVDPSQGYAARKKALEDDYAMRMKEWEKKREAYDNWKPEPYLGYPWKERRAAGGSAVPTNPPAKPGTGSQPGIDLRCHPTPAPQPVVRKTKRGLTYTVQ